MKLNLNHAPGVYLLLIVLLLFNTSSRAQNPKTNDVTAPLHALTPNSPVPYTIPKIEEVRSVLIRIYNYLDSVTPYQFVNRQTSTLVNELGEDVIYRTADNKELRIFTTSIPTDKRLYTLMHDPQYRLSIAWQNVAYNQPPHPGFYFGEGMKKAPRANIVLVKPWKKNNIAVG